jgi:hypothetical protein
LVVPANLTDENNASARPDLPWPGPMVGCSTAMSTDARLTTLEHAMVELATAQARTNANLDRLSDEMRAFKDETRVSNAEMRGWLKDSRRQWGELANKMGTMAEDIVAPSIPAIFQRLFGVDDPDWYVRVRRRHRADRSRRVEFDVVAFGAGRFLAAEVRSSAKPEDLPALLSRFREVRDFFPEAEGMKVAGALATFYLDSSLVLAAEREGLFVFGLGSGLLEILNGPGFAPYEF